MALTTRSAAAIGPSTLLFGQSDDDYDPVACPMGWTHAKRAISTNSAPHGPLCNPYNVVEYDADKNITATAIGLFPAETPKLCVPARKGRGAVPQ